MDRPAKLDSWPEWLIQVNTGHLDKLWAAQPTYLISQTVYIISGLLTLVHALRKGGRWPYFWVGTVLHGVFTDNFWHFVVPEYDNFWHSQSPVMLLGARLPLHIVLLYPAFIYNAAYAVSRLNLPRVPEAMAVGLVTVLIDIPYDIVAVKFVHWTWHDTDPNIFDRHYWVPWNSYYFHAAFAASFFFIFQATRGASKVDKWASAGVFTEMKALILSSLLGMPGGVLLFLPIYHPLHDMLGIHSEVTFFVLIAAFAAVIFNGLLASREPWKERLTFIDYTLVAQLVVHYLIYLGFVIFFNPEKEYSVGLHEPVGPCNEKTPLVTALGLTLYKRKYLCAQDYDEAYFNFCGKIPSNGATWYKICGTPFENRAEYITVISTILVAALGIFYGLYFKTGQFLPAAPVQKTSNKKLKTK